VETTVAFILYVFIGVGEDKRKAGDTLAFRDLTECVFFAQTLHRQGNQITAYCLPEMVPNTRKVY